MNSASSSEAPPNKSESGNPKRAACLTCRKSKLRCVKDDDSEVCTRCKSLNLECHIPEYRVGRHKGTKNRFTGIEKAARTIEKALEGGNRAGIGAGSICDPSRLNSLLEQANSKLNLKRKREDQDSGDLPIPQLHQSHQASNSPQLPYPQLPAFAMHQRNHSPSTSAAHDFGSGSSYGAFADTRPLNSPYGMGSMQYSPRPDIFQNTAHQDVSFGTPILGQSFPPLNAGIHLPALDSPHSSTASNLTHPTSLPDLTSAPSSRHSQHLPLLSHIDPLLPQQRQSPFEGSQNQIGQSPTASSVGDQVQNAENPLGLLASVSERIDMQSHKSTSSSLPSQLQGRFFGSKAFRLDTTSDLDPVALGLVTIEEADNLVNTFHSTLSHTRWGLCAALHTTSFIRSRSSLLLTAMMLGASKFLENHAAITKRLHTHLTLVVRSILEQGFKSIEIVLGLLVCIPWQSPGDNVAEDPTSLYIAMAMNIALDLSLDRKISESEKPIFGQLSLLSPRTALNIDGFPDVHPDSWYGRQLLRSRERAWLSLYVLDRGFALARGRPPMVPVTAAVAACDQWHKSPDADPSDASIAGATVLRRDMDQVIQKIKQLSDQSTMDNKSGQDIRTVVDGYFDRWHLAWDQAIKQGHGFPPYLDILIQHTKLSIYGSVVNYVNASPQVASNLGHWGLSAALNVMRAAVQGEHKLKSMPNNCAVMVSYAVCFVLGIYAKPSNFGSSIEPSVRILIGQAIDVLDRIGSAPSHRRGMSAVYAKALKEAIGNIPFMSTPAPERHFSLETAGMLPINSSSGLELPLFSSMTDNELQHAVGLSMPSIDLAAFESGSEWLDWLTHN